MLVTVTRRHADLICRLCPDADIQQVHESPKGTVVDLAASAETWRSVRDALVAHAFDERGRRRRGLPTVTVAALKRVQEAVTKRETHPALRGVAAAGWHADRICAWPTGDDRWEPYPVDDQQMVVLVPSHHKSCGLFFTTWSPERRHP